MSDDFGFSGRTMLVTGSGRNIGRAIILEFAGRGANVVINARSNEDEAREVEDAAKALGAQTLVVMGDVSHKSVIEEIYARAAERFGHVDMYVSNAARRLHKSFFDTTDEEWHFHLNQQLTASWYLAKAFVPDMKERGWGRIVHINGSDGWRGGWMRVPHSTAKGGLRTLTKSLANGLGEFGITVNDLSPSFADTIRDPLTHPQLTSVRRAEIAAEIPVGRSVAPEEIAWVCAFLCAERSSGITGTAIHVDGGRFML